VPVISAAWQEEQERAHNAGEEAGGNHTITREEPLIFEGEEHDEKQGDRQQDVKHAFADAVCIIP